LESNEPEEKRNANLYNVSFEDDRIFYIDSIVYDIDKNDSLFVEEENKFFQNATVNNITYVRSFDKKRGLLLKVKSTNRTPLDTTIVIAHYKNEQLIKTTAEVWGKRKGWEKMYVYYEAGNPILASPQMNNASVERLLRFGESLVPKASRDKLLKTSTSDVF